MESIETLRRATERRAGIGVNIDPKQIGMTVQNAAANRSTQSDIESLPVDITNWQPLQVLDPSSAYLGVLYFLPGLDVPGNPNRVVR